ncbi:MAG: RNA polymerase sigma factor [Candidatus Acidiferrum sp.]
MSGDSIPIALPLSRLASDGCEVTVLYRELRKPLLRYLVCLGLSMDEAQDAVQDAFLRLHQHLTSGGSQENIRSWVFRVAHNQARNRQTSYARRFGDPLDGEMDAMPDHATPERVLAEKEKLHELGEAIRQLTDSERECLLLRSEGLRYREIGHVLRISTSTVGETVMRAIRRLAEKCNV